MSDCVKERRGEREEGCISLFTYGACVDSRACLFLPVLCASSPKGGKKKEKKKKETEIEEKRLMTGAVMIVVTTVVALLCVVAVVAVLHSWVVARQGLRQFRRDSCGMAHSIRCSLK